MLKKNLALAVATVVTFLSTSAWAQGAAAAANMLSLIDRGSVGIEPITSVVEETTCGGCRRLSVH